ncbi:MAG: dodecin domain-containing protein [Halobacteria archaeon]
MTVNLSHDHTYHGRSTESFQDAADEVLEDVIEEHGEDAIRWAEVEDFGLGQRDGQTIYTATVNVVHLADHHQVE